jgi:hypothetical protein
VKVTVDSPPAGTGPEPPPHESLWPFLMAHGDQITWADTRSELVAVLIDGYDEIADTPDGVTEATWARYRQAVAVAADVQASILADATDKGTFDPEMLAATPEGETILNALMVERTVPLTEVSEWTFEVPLVLVDTDYAPFTERARPDGRIIWIDPSDEARYLDSLERVGRVRVFTIGTDTDAG